MSTVILLAEASLVILHLWQFYDPKLIIKNSHPKLNQTVSLVYQKLLLSLRKNWMSLNIFLSFLDLLCFAILISFILINCLLFSRQIIQSSSANFEQTFPARKTPFRFQMKTVDLHMSCLQL